MFEKYYVMDGDTLESIANKFDTEVRVIQDINNYYYDMIRAGMELIVPKENKEYFNYYTVTTGDNLYAIARKYNINPNLLASMNGMNLTDYIYPDQQLLIPKSGYSYYITADGDTLDTVANTFKITKDKLLNDNKTIYLLSGQLLVNKK